MIAPRLTTLIACSALVAGCQNAPRPSGLPAGDAAYAVAPPVDPAAATLPRTLGPGDEVAIKVYREPDLSVDKVRIDESGMIQLPLLGEVKATGLTLAQLSRTVEGRLGERFVRNPRANAALVSSALQTVTVEGQVIEPGVFAVAPGDTLLTAIARARSATNVARLDEIVIFRTVNGQRMGGVFDLAAIRAGKAPDPQILNGDVVVVGFSAVRGAYRDFLQAAPLLNLFTVF